MKYATFIVPLVAVLLAPAAVGGELYTAEEFIAFRDEAQAVNRTMDNEERISYLRDAIAAHGNHPLNLLLERELVRWVGRREGTELPAVADARKLPALCDVIERYRNVDYYEYLDPRLAFHLDFLIPEMAREAADIELHRNRNPVNARAHLTMALDYVARTLERRRALWPDVTLPEVPPPGASQSERGLFQEQESATRNIADAVEKGTFVVLTDRLCMRRLLYVYANCALFEVGKSPEVALSKIAERYAGTAIERMANAHIAERVKRAADSFGPLVKSGRLIDEAALTAAIDVPAQGDETQAEKESEDLSSDADNTAFEERDLAEGQGGAEGDVGYPHNGRAVDARGSGPLKKTAAFLLLAAVAGLLIFAVVRKRRAGRQT